MKYQCSALPSAHALVRPLVRRLKPYVPGEQMNIKGLIKLNTNENPFPPSPKVLEALRAAVEGRLRLYPNPTSQTLRQQLAIFHNCKLENIIVGNGSDELLALATRAFVEPANRPPQNHAGPRTVVQYFTPSYSLYPVLAAIHGARTNAVPLMADFALPSLKTLKLRGSWDWEAGLSFITTPNAPSGRGYANAELDALCRAHRGVIVLDEAYVDFADQNALGLALRYQHVLVARTFSKAYSLCALRVGYLVGHTELIAALHKIRDSYNVNGLGQIAAQTTLANLAYYRANFRRIVATRERLSKELGKLGFKVWPSQTNFILARPPVLPAKDCMEKLRQKKILVRWFDSPELRAYLRITIGTDAEAKSLVRAVKTILAV